jgi:hypothetical protein
MGHTVILRNIHLLIAQFTARLTSMSKNAQVDEEVDISRRFSSKLPKKPNPTEGLQMNILCRVTELLVAATETNDDHVATMLLKFDSHPNQLYVMRTVNSLIPKLSIEASMSHFHNLSKVSSTFVTPCSSLVCLYSKRISLLCHDIYTASRTKQE